MSKSDERVGAKVSSRLRRFKEKLETLQGPVELPQVLTVRKVKLDLRPRTFSADEVKYIRETLLNVSQAVFAEFLGVATSTASDWEQSRYEPNGPVCRILEEVKRDPAPWKARLRQLATVTDE